MVWDEDESESEQPPRRALIRRHSVRLLQQSHCRSKDNVERLIFELVKGGSGRLQLISTIDHTLTRGQAPNSVTMLMESSVWPESLVEYFNMLPGKIEENCKEIGAHLRGLKIRLHDSDAFSVNFNTSLRDYAKELLEILSLKQIPLLLFSQCGLGDCMLSILRQVNYLFNNIHIISNSLEYQDIEDGLFLKGLKPAPGHSQLTLKENIILLGSKVDDINLIYGLLPKVKNVLKIGFLNEEVEHNLSKFMEAFDMVLVNDQSLDVPLALIELIHKRP